MAKKPSSKKPTLEGLIESTLIRLEKAIDQSRENTKTVQVELAKVSKSLEHLTEQFPLMQAQLDEHTKFSNLAHERIDKAEYSIKELKSTLDSNKTSDLVHCEKLDFLLEYVKDETREKDIRKKIEAEEQESKEKLIRKLRIVGWIIGLPTTISAAFFGLYKLFQFIITITDGLPK